MSLSFSQDIPPYVHNLQDPESGLDWPDEGEFSFRISGQRQNPAEFRPQYEEEAHVDPLSDGFTDSGTYILPNNQELDMGVDWDEPLEVRTRAVKRALKRRLGSEFLDR